MQLLKPHRQMALLDSCLAISPQIWLPLVACSVVPATGKGDAATQGGLGSVFAVGLCAYRRLHRQ